MGTAFRWEKVDGSLILVTFDLPQKSVNTLGGPVLAELDDLVHQLEGHPDLRGLLFQSGKPGQFIAGADLEELAELARATREQVAEFIDRGHRLFDRISRLPFPVVALVDGICMGGGTELILAMDERVVSNSAGTRVALPEVGLGLVPAWGGTQRLPRLIGLTCALEMICGGEPITAERAAALGVASVVAPADRLVEEGIRIVERLQRSGEWHERRRRLRGPLGIGDEQLRSAAGVVERAILARIRGDNPAPVVALKVIRDGCNRDLQDGLEVEREAAIELIGSPIAANLIAGFFARRRPDRHPRVDPSRPVAPGSRGPE